MRDVLLSRSRSGTGRIAGVGLLLGLLLVLGALASSPALHLRFCANANQPGHHCAVTAFAGGVAGISPAPILGVILVILLGAAPIAPDLVHRATPLFQLSRSRPPPLATRLRR